MKCKEHPRYAAMRQPVKTQKHPDGCPTCWGVWEAAKTDPKRLAKTVTIELDVDEARALVLTLARDKTAAQLERLYMVLSQVKNNPQVLEARTMVAALIRQRSNGVVDHLYQTLAKIVKDA